MTLAAFALASFLFCAPPEAIRLADAGEAKIDKENWAGALDDFAAALRLDPDFARAWHGRGIAREGLGDLRGAIEDCDRAIALDPKDPDGFNRRGVARSDSGDLDGALSDFDRALDLKPTRPAIFVYNRGLVRQRKQDLDGALVDYTEAVTLDSGAAFAWINRGFVWLRKGDVDRAISDFSKAIEVGPANPIPWSNRGILRADRELWKDALADLRKAVELSTKENQSARFHVWIVRHRLGEGEAADRELRGWLETGRTTSDARARILGSFLAGDLPEDRVHDALGEYGPAEKAELERLTVESESAAKDMKRTRQLLEAGAASEADADRASLMSRIAEGRLASTRARLERRTEELRCEALFLAGEKRLLAGDVEGARERFQACLDTQVYTDVRAVAGRELWRLGKK